MASKRDTRVDLARLNQQQAAQLIGVTSRTLRDWSDAPRNKDGSYHGPDLVQWLLARKGTDTDFDDQRQRLAAAQAEKVEHENAIRRGELADLRDVARVWDDGVSAARSKLLALPTKVSPQLVNIADANVIATAVRTEIYAALAELADYEPPVESEQPGPGGAEDVPAVGAAANPDGQPVVGSKPPPVQRKQRRARPVAD